MTVKKNTKQFIVLISLFICNSFVYALDFNSVRSSAEPVNQKNPNVLIAYNQSDIDTVKNFHYQAVRMYLNPSWENVSLEALILKCPRMRNFDFIDFDWRRNKINKLKSIRGFSFVFYNYAEKYSQSKTIVLSNEFDSCYMLIIEGYDSVFIEKPKRMTWFEYDIDSVYYGDNVLLNLISSINVIRSSHTFSKDSAGSLFAFYNRFHTIGYKFKMDSFVRGKINWLVTNSDLPADQSDFTFKKNFNMVKDHFLCFQYLINKHICEKDLKEMYFRMFEGYRGHVSSSCVYSDSIRSHRDFITLHLELMNTEDSIMRYLSQFDSLHIELMTVHPISLKTLKLFRNSSTIMVKMMDNEAWDKISLRKIRRYNRKFKRLGLNITIDESNKYKTQQ